MIDTKDNVRKTSGHDARFEATLLRAQFDANKHITSLAKATQLLKDGEELISLIKVIIQLNIIFCHGLNL